MFSDLTLYCSQQIQNNGYLLICDNRIKFVCKSIHLFNNFNQLRYYVLLIRGMCLLYLSKTQVLPSKFKNNTRAHLFWPPSNASYHTGHGTKITIQQKDAPVPSRDTGDLTDTPLPIKWKTSKFERIIAGEARFYFSFCVSVSWRKWYIADKHVLVLIRKRLHFVLFRHLNGIHMCHRIKHKLHRKTFGLWDETGCNIVSLWWEMGKRNWKAISFWYALRLESVMPLIGDK